MTAKEYLTGLSKKRKNILIKLERGNISQHCGALATGKSHQEEVAEYREQLQALRKKIFAEVNLLDDPTHKTLLTLRYAEGLGWDKIAEKMHYSTRHLSRVHGRALQSLAQIGERLWTI